VFTNFTPSNGTRWEELPLPTIFGNWKVYRQDATARHADDLGLLPKSEKGGNQYVKNGSVPNDRTRETEGNDEKSSEGPREKRGGFKSSWI